MMVGMTFGSSVLFVRPGWCAEMRDDAGVDLRISTWRECDDGSDRWGEL